MAIATSKASMSGNEKEKMEKTNITNITDVS